MASCWDAQERRSSWAGRERSPGGGRSEKRGKKVGQWEENR